MPVTSASLFVSNGGRITASMFPELDSEAEVLALLDKYIEEGDAKADDVTDTATKDIAVTLWAYHRAFEAAATDLKITPASASLSDQGSISYSQDQRDYFLSEARRYGLEFDALLEVRGDSGWPIITSRRRNAA
jgi:hypothetical protein